MCALPLKNDQNCYPSILIWNHFDIKIDKVPFKSHSCHLLSAVFFPLILNGKKQHLGACPEDLQKTALLVPQQHFLG